MNQEQSSSSSQNRVQQQSSNRGQAQSRQPRSAQSNTPRSKKYMLYNWEFTHDDEGQFVLGILVEDNEQKEWETSYLSKIVMHRQYVEAHTQSGSIYLMEYKHAKSGGHTLYL